MPKAKESNGLPTTMYEIAERAGVSEATVSRALSGSNLVNKETKEKILKIANALKYRVNMNARNLRRGKNKTIELLIPLAEYGRQHMSDPFYLDMLGVLADDLDSRGYDLLITKRAPWARHDLENPLLTGKADGIIIMGQGQDLASLKKFTSIYKEVVVWGGDLGGNDYVVVGTNNVEGGYTATNHLLQLGRRKIVFMGDPAEPEIALRLKGFKKALIDFGIPQENHLFFLAPFEAQQARLAAQSLVESKLIFDAIFCASDVIAMNTIIALRSAGISVPEQVSIVGYDNIVMSSTFEPTISTISQRVEIGGKLMVDLLLDLIEGNKVTSKLLPIELIKRQSCGG